MLISCSPSAPPTLKPLLFTPMALLTLLAILITILVLSKERSYLLPSLAIYLLLRSRTGLALTVSGVTLVLIAPSLALIQLLLLGLPIVLIIVLVYLVTILLALLMTLRSILLI